MLPLRCQYTGSQTIKVTTHIVNKISKLSKCVVRMSSRSPALIPRCSTLLSQLPLLAAAFMHRLGLTPYVDIYFGKIFEPHTCSYYVTERVH